MMLSRLLEIGRGQAALLLMAGCLVMTGCTNAPYPSQERDGPVIYSFLSEDPKTLDPTIAYDTNVSAVLAQIDDPFLQYNYLKRNPLVLEPLIGARMPTRTPQNVVIQEPVTGPDGKPRTGPNGQPLTHPVVHQGELWTFTIKKGIHYADDPCFPGGKGREVTAADFLYAFKRMADPSLTPPCPILSYLTPHIVGLQEYADKEAARLAAGKKSRKPYTANLFDNVRGLQTDPEDPYTFRILLQDHYPELQYLMAMQFTAPIPHEAVEYYTGGKHGLFRSHPVGAGPYRLVEWDERQKLVLERNPNYHTDRYPTSGEPGDRAKGLLQDAGKPLPFTKKLVFTIIKESVPGWNLFLQGYLDGFYIPRESFSHTITAAGGLSPDMEARGIQLSKSSGVDTQYIAFNMEDSLVGGYTPKKQKLRQALSLAFDSDEFIDLTLNGRGVPAQGCIPPGLFGYDPKYRNPYRQTNLEKARKLLAEAGYPDGIDPSTGKPLVINFDDDAQSPEETQQLALIFRQLEQLGIRVNERQQTFAVFQDRVNAGQFQVIYFGWVADYPDPENFFLLFYGPNKGPGPNSARYNNPEFNELYREMAGMPDGPERLKLIDRMRTILQEDCPWIFVYHSLGYGLHYSWLKNSKPHPVAYNSDKYLQVDYQTRFQKQEQWNHPRYLVLFLVLLALVLGTLPAMVAARQRRMKSVKATRRTLISQGGSGSRGAPGEEGA